MKILAGLGNPGPKYQYNRHNIGFMIVEKIAQEHGFASWRNKFQSDICEGKLGTEKVLLLKPNTFMNLSGQAVGEAMRFYKLEAEDIIVFHDELDLAPGKLRIKYGGGHGGHNGLKNCDQHLGKNYMRVRLGIGHPGDKARVNAHVLGDFAKADYIWLDKLLETIAQNAPMLAKGDTAGLMNKVARAVHAKQEQKKETGKHKTEREQLSQAQNQSTQSAQKSALAEGLKKLLGINNNR